MLRTRTTVKKFFFLSLILTGTNVQALPSTDTRISVHSTIPIILKANEFSESVATVPISQINILTFNGSKLVPIPFQIDEIDQDGLVHIPNVSEKPLLGKADFFDAEDELIFMASDTSSKSAPSELLSKFQLLETIKVELAHLPIAKAYVVADNNRVNTPAYVTTDLTKGMVRNNSLEIWFDPKDISNIKTLSLKSHTGQMSHNVLSEFKFKISTGILSQKVRINAELGKEIKAVPLAVNSGPIRSTLLIEGKFHFMGLPVYRDRLSINFYKHSVNIPTRFTQKGMKSVHLLLSVIRKPKFEMNLTFKHLRDATLGIDSYRFKDHAHIAQIDGKMSPAEYDFNQEKLPGDYIWINSHTGWQCILTNTLPVVPDGLFDSFLEGMSITVNYEDLPLSNGAVSVDIAVEGVPKAAIALLKELDRIDIQNINNLNELMVSFSELDQQGQLKKLDQINQKVIAERIQTGKIQKPEDYINSFLADLNKIAIKGVNRIELNRAIYSSISKIQTLEQLKQMRIGEVIHNFQIEAKKINLDLSHAMRANIDNTFWIPIDLKPIDPDIFYKISSASIDLSKQ